MNKTFSEKYPLLHIGIIVISFLLIFILYWLWTSYSDYVLNMWFVNKYYGVNIWDVWHNDKLDTKIIVFSSLHIYIFPIINLIYPLFYAFFGVIILNKKIEKNKVDKIYWIIFLILWFIKIPLFYKYSSLPSTMSALFAW